MLSINMTLCHLASWLVLAFVLHIRLTHSTRTLCSGLPLHLSGIDYIYDSEAVTYQQLVIPVGLEPNASGLRGLRLNQLDQGTI